ncbi:unnamed protein product [Gadus morhua 'NCC']
MPMSATPMWCHNPKVGGLNRLDSCCPSPPPPPPPGRADPGDLPMNLASGVTRAPRADKASGDARRSPPPPPPPDVFQTCQGHRSPGAGRGMDIHMDDAAENRGRRRVLGGGPVSTKQPDDVLSVR